MQFLHLVCTQQPPRHLHNQAAFEALRIESDARMSDLQARTDAAAKEVEEVRGRARALMEEKDATIAALKRPGGGPSSGNTTPLVSARCNGSLCNLCVSV